LISKLTHFNKN